MGQEIVYCFKCSSRIVGTDSAYTVGDRAACAACANEILPTLPERDQEQLLAQMQKGHAPKGRAPSKRTPSRGTEVVPPSRPAPAAPFPLAVAGVIGVIILLLVIVLFSRSSPPRVADPEPERRTLPPVPVAVDKPKPKESFDAELARIDDSIAGVMRQEGFKEALDYLSSARKRHDAPVWIQAIDKRLGRTNDEIQTVYAALEKQAADARRLGSESGVKEIVDRVGRWNLPDRSTALRKAIDGIVPAVFRQGTDGIVCIEAEHCMTQTEADGHAWKPVREPAGFQGDGAMSAAPNNGGQYMEDYAAKSPKMEYRIDFVRTGPHYLWVRAYADTTADNSVHAGLDRQPLPTLSAISWSVYKKWVWTNKKMDNQTASFTIATAGPHTLQMWIREDGAVVDRFVITSDPKWTPKGNGPAESPR